MDKVALLSEKDRRQLFAETAAAMKTVPAITEKDFWVVWVLDKLFSHAPLKDVLQFKGGTSLSKAFHLIGRFSEDIDLILDWREVAQGDPNQERTQSQQNKFNEATNEQAKAHIENILLPDISALLAPLCDCQIDAGNRFNISVRYPALYEENSLRPEILLEIGPLASWSPSALFEIEPYAARYFPQVFEKSFCRVPTILAKRTFWEKATILHQEAHREMQKPMSPRYSRHYYDLAWLARSPVKAEALADFALLDEVTAFKQRFYPSGWAHYELAKPGGLKLLPPEVRMREIESDYKKMQEMIFDMPLSLDDIVQTLRDLESEINALGDKI